MNINERKRSSASARASQAICGQPFCPLINGFCSKICSSKRLLVRFEDNAVYGKIVLQYHILQLTACKMVQKLR